MTCACAYVAVAKDKIEKTKENVPHSIYGYGLKKDLWSTLKHFFISSAADERRNVWNLNRLSKWLGFLFVSRFQVQKEADNWTKRKTVIEIGENISFLVKWPRLNGDSMLLADRKPNHLTKLSSGKLEYLVLTSLIRVCQLFWSSGWDSIGCINTSDKKW